MPAALHAVARPEVAAGFRTGTTPLIQPVGLSTDWSDVIAGAVPDVWVDTHGMAVTLALEGAGAALTHVLISRPAILSGRLVALDVTEVPAREGYYLAVRDGAMRKEGERFADWFRSVVAAQWRVSS